LPMASTISAGTSMPVAVLPSCLSVVVKRMAQG
jgi:hypothetical protein